MYYLCFFKQKTAYEMRISDWSSDVCSSDLKIIAFARPAALGPVARAADRNVRGHRPRGKVQDRPAEIDLGRQSLAARTRPVGPFRPRGHAFERAGGPAARIASDEIGVPAGQRT